MWLNMSIGRFIKRGSGQKFLLRRILDLSGILKRTTVGIHKEGETEVRQDKRIQEKNVTLIGVSAILLAIAGHPEVTLRFKVPIVVNLTSKDFSRAMISLVLAMQESETPLVQLIRVNALCRMAKLLVSGVTCAVSGETTIMRDIQAAKTKMK